MVRVLDRDLDLKATIFSQLIKIFGIGKSRARNICNQYELKINEKVKDIDINTINNIHKDLVADSNLYGVDLEDWNRKTILNKSGTVRLIRIARGLPVTGRTRSNGNTASKLNPRRVRDLESK